MKFQTDEKDLAFFVIVLETVPSDIYSDEKRFKQVLFNLIGNALKFTYVGTISLDLSYDFDLSKLAVSVEDSGIGIKTEDLHNLFKFFGQVSSSKNINKSGMGLGLTISKLIIQQLGGDIEVKS